MQKCTLPSFRKIILILWIIFSGLYIVYDLWTDFKTQALNNAYLQGKTDTIKQLIQESEGCHAVNVFTEEEKIELIDVKCVSQENNSSEENPLTSS